MIENNFLEIINDYQEDIPVNVAQLSKALGIDMYKSNMEGISGAIVKEGEKYSIYINNSDAIVRQRFTAAHEIAHFLLHRQLIGNNLTDNAMYRSRLSNVYERQANRLASEILMPAMYVDKFINENRGIYEMSTLFNVSEDAMRIRLNEGGNIFLEYKNFKLIKLAKMLINHCLDNNFLSCMSNDLKVEKINYLLYFIYGEYLKLTYKLLFDEKPVSMYANPAFLTIENEYRSGNLVFDNKYKDLNGEYYNINNEKDEALKKVFDKVLNTFGKTPPDALESFKKSQRFWWVQGNTINEVPLEVIKKEFYIE